VLFADYSRAELVAQVRRAGVRVFLLRNYATLDESLASLRELARELRPDAEARAEKIVTDCRARVAALEEKLRGRPRVRVIAPSTYGVIGGAGTTFQDLCDRAGAENLAVTLGHLVGHAQPPNERMLTWPIERVVLPGDNLDDALAPYLKLPPYQFMLAVRERRVAVIPSWQMSTVSHRRVDAYETLARALHPEVFAR
jgi:iron complex transport system substrate-binding protein